MISQTTYQSRPAAEQNNSFTHDFGKVMERVRLTLTDLFSHFPSGIRKSRDAQKYLGVDSNLSWLLLKVLACPDALGASRFMPSGVSMQRVFDAARKKGLDRAKVDEAEQAFKTFERFVEDHAGDRASLESMVAGRTFGDQNDAIYQADLQSRKAIFKGHMYYWGMEVATRSVTAVIAPSQSDKNKADYGHIRTFHGLRRLRAEANMLVDRIQMLSGDKQPVKTPLMPIDPETMERIGAPLVETFCSKPLPEFSTISNEHGETRTELLGAEVGQKSRVDLAFGSLCRDTDFTPGFNENQLMIGTRTRVWIPTKLLVLHILVHAGSFPNDRMQPLLKVNGHALQTRPNDMYEEHGQLPFTEQLQYVGRGEVGVHTIDVPKHVQIARYITDKAGWNLADFDVYRARIEYPMMDTTVSGYLLFDED